MALVALFTRAWIEITILLLFIPIFNVALFTRAWIEIKLYPKDVKSYNVALFTRAWIEIYFNFTAFSTGKCRPLHEGVD